MGVRGAVENYDTQVLCMGQNVIAAPEAWVLVDVGWTRGTIRRATMHRSWWKLRRLKADNRLRRTETASGDTKSSLHFRISEMQAAFAVYERFGGIKCDCLRVLVKWKHRETVSGNTKSSLH